MRYWPVASVTTDRTRSIKAGLAASTRTPGRIAPELSLTTPVIAAWAKTVDGKSSETRTNRKAHEDRRNRFGIAVLLTGGGSGPTRARERSRVDYVWRGEANFVAYGMSSKSRKTWRARPSASIGVRFVPDDEIEDVLVGRHATRVER